MDFAVFNQEGKSLRNRTATVEESLLRGGTSDGFVPGIGGAHFQAIRMGESTWTAQNLLDFFGEGQGGCSYYLKSGLYSVTALGLPSDTLSFRVVEPRGSSDSSAMELVIRTADSCFSASFGTSELKFRFFKDFVDRFPNSVYTPWAVNHLLGVSTVDSPLYDASKRQYYIRYMISHFPESGFAWSALIALDPSMVGYEEKTQVAAGLRKWKAHLGAEDLRKRADELIRQLEK